MAAAVARRCHTSPKRQRGTGPSLAGASGLCGGTLPPQRPRSHLMRPCPSDETLTGLLAEALTTAERDRLARHVEGCAPCQEKLARLSGTPDTQRWRRAGHPPQGSEAEEGMVCRLKQVPPSSAA